ncbi:Hypothetical protein CAP_8418 [Chondromyces apiculatus DSM 436]|uniref:Uncharacterized protein n=1 Tax=Chondromyces apiculatus DSM 436 TaxID=1192034 RepID=A0A017SYJ3_9BACT|nr:Hypothetical protein CAP_8418 [Chondromyces apiculatus DSM 436]
MTIALEGQVTHSRVRSMSDVHSRDITVALGALVQRGLLESAGRHKGTKYFFPGEPPPPPSALIFEAELKGEVPADLSRLLANSQARWRGSEDSEASSEHRGASSEHRGASSDGRSPGNPSSPAERARLMQLAEGVRTQKRVGRFKVEAVLLDLCRGRFLTLAELSTFTGRNPDALRMQYLTSMVAAGKLRLLHPESPTHPSQAYTTVQ